MMSVVHKHLSPLAKDVVEIGQRQPVPYVVVLVHALNCLLAARLAQLDLLDPALDVLLARKLKHLLHLRSVTNVRCTHVVAVGREDLSVEAGEVVIREADHVEVAVDLECGEVLGEIKLVGRIGGVDDEIELVLELLIPALLAGDEEVLRTHLERVLLLAGGVRDDSDLGAHGNSPQDTEVTQTTKTNDTDLLARAST